MKGELSTHQPPDEVWQSVAEWPKGTICCHANDITTDDHGSMEQASGVVALLKKNGFGGDGKVFPIRAYVRLKPECEAARRERVKDLLHKDALRKFEGR